MATSIPNWANIPDGVLRYIADMAYSVEDRVHMAAVCRPWQASLIDQKLNFPACLMLAEVENSDKRSFYNVSEDVFVELDLPEVRGRRCWGSSFGWLVTCGLDLQIQLFNPLSRASLPLPSIPTFPNQEEDWSPEKLCKFFLKKVILSSSPALTNSDCIVMAIFSYFRLAFAKPGDRAWTPIDNANLRSVEDVIYFKGNFYVCKQSGEIFVCEGLDGSVPKVVNFAPPPPTPDYTSKYLFDLGGNLCLASRWKKPTWEIEEEEEVDDDSDSDGDYSNDSDYSEDEDDSDDVDEDNDNDDNDSEDEVEDMANALPEHTQSFVTVKFEIFKLDMLTRSWDKIYSLGDNSLFLGNCSTFAIAAADYPGSKPNCIYFTDDDPVYYDTNRGSDMGIHNCHYEELLLVELFPKSKDVEHLLSSSFSPPLWVIPSYR